jgi:hypothetical protein
MGCADRDAPRRALSKPAAFVVLCKGLALKKQLTAERLRELLHYDPETGIFTRKISITLSKQFKAGDVAGGIDKSLGYIVISVENARYRAHRLAWFYVYGVWPVHGVDHINGIRNDNRLSNLREANKSQNGQNVHKCRSSSSSGVLGVTQIKKTGRWQATITIDGKVKYLGRFLTSEDARTAYLSAKARLHPFAPNAQ